jgi:hypothetical protein
MVVLVVVIQLPPVAELRYWTLYEEAPETADQFNVADEDVMFVALKPEGIPQVVPVPEVVKVPEAEKVPSVPLQFA